MRKDSPIKLSRRLQENGKWLYLCNILEENHFYFVHDQNSLTHFAGAMTTELGSWPSEAPWERITSFVNEPEELMTSSYEETVNYLKVNLLIGVI